MTAHLLTGDFAFLNELVGGDFGIFRQTTRQRSVPYLVFHPSCLILILQFPVAVGVVSRRFD